MDTPHGFTYWVYNTVESLKDDYFYAIRPTQGQWPLQGGGYLVIVLLQRLHTEETSPSHRNKTS